MNIGRHVKYPLLFSDFDETFNFLDIFSKYLIPNFLKIRPMRAELFHADGRTDLTELIVAFRNFAKVRKNGNVTKSLPQRLVNALQFYE